MIPSDRVLRSAVKRVWLQRVTVQSNFARKHAAYVAMAASLQLITTQVGRSQFTTIWRITTKGLKWLQETEE